MFQNREIVRALFELERSEPGLIASFRFQGFLAWPIVKSALCYKHLKSYVESSEGNSHDQGSSRGKMLLHLVSGLASVMLKKARGLNKVLFLTKAVDKLARVNGRYFNFLVDGMVTRGIATSYIYAEEPAEGDYRTPAAISTDVKMDGLAPLISYYRKTLDRAEATSLAETLEKKVNEFLQNNHWDFSIQEEDIKELLVNFHAEYKAARLLLRLVHPKLIITSERIGTGFMAAARNLEIPVIDLQHGMIDSVEPMYQYAGSLAPYKKEMLLPDLVAVWGIHHQRILLQHQFWARDEIYVLGNQRMELNREKIKDGERKDQVLIATQWTVFNETCQLLEALDAVDGKQFGLVLKLHPMEPPQFKAYFESFAATREWVTIAGSTSDIYELFGEVKVLLGFNSASLIEAAALRTPVISLLTESMPDGIYGQLGNDIRSEGIRTVPLGSTEEMVSLLNKAMSDTAFYGEWQAQAEELGSELFAKDVFKKAKEMVSTLLLPGRFQSDNKKFNTYAA